MQDTEVTSGGQCSLKKLECDQNEKKLNLEQVCANLSRSSIFISSRASLLGQKVLYRVRSTRDKPRPCLSLIPDEQIEDEGVLFIIKPQNITNFG